MSKQFRVSERNEISKELSNVINNENIKIFKTYTYTDYMIFVIINDEGWTKEKILNLKNKILKREYFDNYYLIFKIIFHDELIIHLAKKSGR